MSLLTNWLESLSYELEISEFCTRNISPLSTCTACIDGCPDGAIILEEGKISIEEEKCSACGVCITVCPVQAIKGQSPARKISQNHLLLEEASPVPSLMEMLYYHKKGIRFIYQPTIQKELVQRINKVNEVLGTMVLQPIQVTQQINLSQEIQPKLSRRDFFAKLSADSKKTVLSSVTPVKWRFNESSFKASVLFKDWAFHKVRISKADCTLCEACFTICPADVFSLEENNLQIIDHLCTGCYLCVDICQTHSIQAKQRIHQAAPALYNVHQNICSKCGSRFYSWEESSSCHVCSTIEKPNFFL
ncbi:4Fe-4S dicluster domain-containing protein [Mesobacillus subterraneus]|nr:4Fe-4S dicluster domain-containing protein [Mesobacillus subterraneus]